MRLRLEIALILLLALAASAPVHLLVRWLALLILTVWTGVTALSLLPPPRGRSRREPQVAPGNRLLVLSDVVRSALGGSKQSRRIVADEVADLAREAGFPRSEVEAARRELLEVEGGGDLAAALESWLAKIRGARGGLPTAQSRVEVR